MKEIPLTQSKVALVDDSDHERLSRFKWCVLHPSKESWYAVRVVKRHGVQAMILMHRAIMNPSSDMQVDHIDGDGLNNQRSNLRVATRLQNQRNRQHMNKNNSSGYRGVTWAKNERKWRAQLSVNYKGINLGYFNDSQDAAIAYDIAAIKHFGTFAVTNFPKENYGRK